MFCSHMWFKLWGISSISIPQCSIFPRHNEATGHIRCGGKSRTREKEWFTGSDKHGGIQSRDYNSQQAWQQLLLLEQKQVIWVPDRSGLKRVRARKDFIVRKNRWIKSGAKRVEDFMIFIEHEKTLNGPNHHDKSLEEDVSNIKTLLCQRRWAAVWSKEPEVEYTV